ncbi:unnamed protein product [Amoebophrya sp. A25]|nr:unnamed protein product [Amoebophrya sp. A25]|eukprot:GSA25T00014720001.1
MIMGHVYSPRLVLLSSITTYCTGTFQTRGPNDWTFHHPPTGCTFHSSDKMKMSKGGLVVRRHLQLLLLFAFEKEVTLFTCSGVLAS